MSTRTLMRIRKALSLVGILSILSSLLVLAPVASAYEASDAPEWAQDATAQAFELGLRDPNVPNMNFSASVNRASAAKMLVEAFGEDGGLEADDVENPFDDVPDDAWYAGYAKLAYAYGWFEGQVVGDTRWFKGNDIFTREQFATVLLRLAGGSEVVDVDSSVLDELSDTELFSEWALEGAAFAKEMGLLFQEPTGAPQGSVNNAMVNVIMIRTVDAVDNGDIEVSYEPVDTGDDDDDDDDDVSDDDDDDVEVPAGSLSLGLSSNSPAATIFADGTAGDVLAKVVLTAGDGDVTVNGLKVRHYGISADSDISGMYALDEAGVRHGNVVTFSENVADLTFSNNPIVVRSGDSSVISLVANISASAGAKTIGVGIASAADVTSNATSVEGSFPIQGAVHTTVDGANSVATLTVDSATISTATRNVNVGTINQDVGKFTFAAGSNENVMINRIVLLNNGNAGDGDFQNIKVIDPKGVVLCTVERSVAKVIDCNMSAAPHRIEKGVSETFRVVVDVKSGSTRTVQMRIQNDYDIEAMGETTAAGILATAVSNGVTSTSHEESFPIGDGPVAGAGDNSGTNATNFNSLTFGAGTLLVSKDSSSPSGNVSQGGKQVVVGVWKLEATGEDMEVQRVCIDLDSASVAAFSEADLSGTIRVRRSNGASIYSVTPAALHVDGTCDQVTLSSYFTVKAGQTETLSIVIDYAAAAGPAGTSHTATLGSVYYKRLDTNDFNTAASTAIAANTLTIQVASLTPTSNPSYSNQTIVRGGGQSLIGSFQLQAGSAENVSVQTVLVSLDNDSVQNLADDDTLTGVSNLTLKKGTTTLGTAIGSPSGNASGNSYTVSGQLDISASDTVTVDVYADLATNADSTVRAFIPASGITFVGSSSNASSNTPTAAQALQTITTAASGTLRVLVPLQSTQRVLHAGETATELLSFQLEAVSEAVTLDKLLVTAVNGGGNFLNLRLTDSAGTNVYRQNVSLVNGIATFSGLTLTVPKDNTVTYRVWGDTAASGTLVAAQNVEMRLASIDARGFNSGSSILERSITTEASSTSSAGHYPVSTVVAYPDAATSTAAPDTFGYVTTLNEEGSDLTAGSTRLAIAAQGGTAGGAVTAVASGQPVTKVRSDLAPSTTAGDTVRTTTVAADSGTHTFAAGDMVFVFDVNSATNTGLSVVSAFTNNGGGAGLDNADALTLRLLETADGTGTAFTAATGDVVVRVGSTSRSSFDEADVTNGTGFAFVQGDVCLWGDTTATNSNFFVVITAAGAGADVSAADAVATGVDLDNGDSVTCYTSISNEAPSTASTYGYNVGEIVAVTDASTPANNGFHVVQTAAKIGDDISGGTNELGINIDLATGDRLAKFFPSPSVSNVHVVHDVEPVITRAATTFSTQVLQSTQDVAVFDITASGPRNMSISAISIFCAGAGASNTELPDNAIEIRVDGAVQASSAENAATCATGNGRAHTFTTPIEIAAGTSKSFTVRMDTGADAGQWSTGESVLVRIAGTAGRTGGGLSWFYTSAAPSPGTEPTSSSPATVSDSYPVDGPALTF